MKVLIVSQSDVLGGAARASLRLLQALRGVGVDARMAVGERKSSEPFVSLVRPRVVTRMLSYANRLPRRLLGKRAIGPWTDQGYIPTLTTGDDIWQPEVVNVHWLGSGLARPSKILPKCPQVWTLHDSWMFTGGCHLPGSCVGFKSACWPCPSLSATGVFGTRRSFEAKRSCAISVAPTIVAPSAWLAKQAEESTVLRGCRVVRIPNPIDQRVYFPDDRASAQRLFGVVGEDFTVGFISHSLQDPNKGLASLLEALSYCGHPRLLLVGSPGPGFSMPRNAKLVGPVEDENRLREFYSAIDLLVVPSRSENLPQVAIESISCGTPVVAFEVGGLPDIVQNTEAGVLVKPYDLHALAQAVSRYRLKRGSDGTRWLLHKQIKRFSMASVGERYTTLFEGIIGSAKLH